MKLISSSGSSQALAEERSVYNRSVNKLKYLSVAVNALKRLKNQSTVAAKGEDLHEVSLMLISCVWLTHICLVQITVNATAKDREAIFLLT